MTGPEIIGAAALLAAFVIGYLIGVRAERRHAARETQTMLNRYSDDYRA